MNYRVWYRNGSARLVDAETAEEARGVGKELAQLDAQDLSIAYSAAKKDNPDRARELAKEWLGCTTVAKVETLGRQPH